jgi:hypothetical protein
VSTLRSMLASHRAKRIYIWFFAVVLTAAIALRVEAAIYARRIVSVVTALSTLRGGETSKADTLQRIPALRPSKSGPHGAPVCDADECFSGFIANGMPGRILLRIWRTGADSLSPVLRWWGFRFESLDVYVNFKSEKVSGFGYLLWVSAPGIPKGVPPPPRDGEAGIVTIGVSSQRVITGGETKGTVETRPSYRIIPARAAPSQSIGIAVTPDTPDEIMLRAFDFRLNCVWSFGGCRRWDEILPSVEPLVGR